jgi:hypothetical protein
MLSAQGAIRKAAHVICGQRADKNASIRKK